MDLVSLSGWRGKGSRSYHTGLANSSIDTALLAERFARFPGT
jgi:hypothetical protein